MNEFEIVIGLEVHVQLATHSKVFCGCATEFGKDPNTQTCPICLGFPGSLPVLNKRALDYGLKTAAALGCQINEHIRFDRKNYFYPDLPKNYQISQYKLPLAEHGCIMIETHAGNKKIGVTRVHLEEDAGKLVHDEKKEVSFVDYNRAGMPLLEIVSEPDINSPDEAYSYLGNLKAILKYLGVSDCDMEKGSLRCDANISLRKKGEQKLGVKTELKNMNSFKAVRQALQFEAQRQERALTKRLTITQETLLWDETSGVTVAMRSKEEAHDYRYFPEPDLVPFVLSPETIESITRSIPELPQARLSRFIEQLSLSRYDAEILILDKSLADYFELCLRLCNEPKLLSNWLTGPVMQELNDRKISIVELGLFPQHLIDLVLLVKNNTISNLAAKDVLKRMFATKKAPLELAKEMDLVQISDEKALQESVETAIRENAGPVADYKSGKENALMFLVGQVMKKTKGKANPKVVKELLQRRMGNG